MRALGVMENRGKSREVTWRIDSGGKKKRSGTRHQMEKKRKKNEKKESF